MLGSMFSLTHPAITVATSEQTGVPSAIGLWRRTIVLPSWTVRELSPNDLNAILLHEFAHLRRGDDWTNLVQKIVRALFFFHPAVWWIDARLSTEREMACDDAVLAETGNPRGYANCLVSLLERSLAHRGWSMAQAAVHRAREASLRLAQILSKNRPTKTRVWTPAVGMVGVFSILCLAASPRAPQLISFTGGARDESVARVSPMRADLISQASKPSPGNFVVPARLNYFADSAPTVSDERRPLIKHAATRNHLRGMDQSVVATRFHSKGEMPAQILAVSTRGAQEMAPQFETLMFVETTQYESANGPVVLRVWTMTWVRMLQPASYRMPVANSI